MELQGGPASPGGDQKPIRLVKPGIPRLLSLSPALPGEPRTRPSSLSAVGWEGSEVASAGEQVL